MDANVHSPTAFWLLLTLIMTGVLYLPYVLHRMATLGLARTFGNPQPGDPTAHAPWAQRAKAAHANAVENLVVFAPLILLAMYLGQGGTPLVTNAAMAYFFGRLAHYVFYTAGVPVARTLAFFVGFFAEVAIIVALL